MRTIRIHVDAPLQAGGDIALPVRAAAHVARVLRMQAGDPITLFNGDGYEYPSKLTGAASRRLHAHVDSRSKSFLESPLRIMLAQALARGEKMDWIVQKAAELGVAAIVPVVTERSEVKLDDKRAVKRLEHWHAVVIAACEQSGRAVIPSIAAPQALDRWLASIARDDTVRLVLHPGDGIAPRTLQPAPRAVTLAIGPEGGFGERDLDALRQASFRHLSLGPRILRTETAGIAAVAALQALYGDF